jgi:hypothetical protein
MRPWRSALSRRDFLKVGGAYLGASFLPRLGVSTRYPIESDRLCRITELKASLRARPDPDAAAVGGAALDDVLVVDREVVGRGVYPHNHVWFETPQGFVWSSEAQPVRNAPNTVQASLPADGVWTEITIPYADGHVSPDPAAAVRYRLYYSMVLNVNQAVAGADGRAWYRVEDENGIVMYAPGESFRLITPEEVAPVAPEPKGHPLISNGRIWSLEDGIEVYYCRIAPVFLHQGRRAHLEHTIGRTGLGAR